MPYKDIMKTIPTIQATALAGHNIKKVKKPLDTEDMVKLGVTNIVGTSLIKSTADLI